MYSLPVLNTVFVLKPDLYGRRRIIDLENMLVKTIDAMLLERLANADYSAFDEIYDRTNYELVDMIKVIHDDKEYYFQRRYG